jgi:hypothetical protein
MRKFLTVFLILIIALAFIACDDKPKDEQAEYRETTITLNFGSNAHTIKVSGTLLATEWNGVPAKVETLLETAYPANPTTMDDLMVINDIEAVFGRTGVNVIVENTTAYTNYKIIGDGKTLYLRYSALNSISTDTIREAIKKMEANETHSN